MRKRKETIIKKTIPVIAMMLCVPFIYLAYMIIVPYGSCINIVSGNSMYPSLEDGQIIFSDDVDVIRRGDIVTSYYPKHIETNERELIVKRVIGIPGDNLLINETGVYINGEKTDEAYLTEVAKQSTFKYKEEIQIVLKDDEYFLMGDNREISFDSRAFGVVTADRICFRQEEKPTKQFWIKMVLLMGAMLLISLWYIVIYVILLDWYKGKIGEKEKQVKEELYLFDGKKSVLIDYELFNCYEYYVDKLSERKINYLVAVLKLTEKMSENELSERLSKAMYEDIYMATVMEEDLLAAMTKMLAEEKEEIKVVEVKSEIFRSDEPKNIIRVYQAKG